MGDVFRVVRGAPQLFEVARAVDVPDALHLYLHEQLRRHCATLGWIK
jgi:hypothetical protein